MLGGGDLGAELATGFVSRLVVENVRRDGVDFGLRLVNGSLTVKSTSQDLNAILTNNDTFQITANLKKGELTKTVAFDECYLDGKQAGLDANGVMVTTYAFTATRVREE